MPLQNRGCYMFRIDADHVVDATNNGGLARYVQCLVCSTTGRTFLSRCWGVSWTGTGRGGGAFLWTSSMLSSRS